MVPDNFLQPAPNNFGKAHLIFRRDPFCFTEKEIRDLDLCFYHDGILPHGNPPFNLGSASHVPAHQRFDLTPDRSGR